MSSTSPDSIINSIPSSTHKRYLHECLTLSRNSPPKPSNFRVGALLVSFTTSTSQGNILSSGYTLELPGNTHAEQNAFEKLLISSSSQDTANPDTTDLPQDLSSLLPPSSNVVLYTSLEPCSKRLSGATPCVQRIIATRDPTTNSGIQKVIFGAKEPDTFVKDSASCRILTDAGVEWEYIDEMEEEILRVAMEGHEKKEEKKPNTERETKIDEISDEERRRQEQLPRNPKKRMMELDRNDDGK